MEQATIVTTDERGYTEPVSRLIDGTVYEIGGYNSHTTAEVTNPSDVTTWLRRFKSLGARVLGASGGSHAS